MIFFSVSCFKEISLQYNFTPLKKQGQVFGGFFSHLWLAKRGLMCYIFIMMDIQKALDALVPNPTCELNFQTTFQLLVAVVLSAQCTDARVNKVTKSLFQKYPSAKDFANLSVETLGKEIYSLGFYRAKAKNLIEMSKAILENFGGKVPCTMEELTTLSGVGRKTASVVLAEGFNIPAFAVDTHVFRVANRLGIGDEKSPEACETALKNFFPQESWVKTHLQMVLFGRYTCKAQNPKCEGCPFQSICKYFQKKG